MRVDMSTFLQTYSINHPIEALFCLLSLVPSSLLLIVVQKSTMHPNCRALISLWTFTQISMNLSMLTYCYYFIFVEYEVYPKTQFFPPIRTFFTEQAIRMWCMCSCFELGISLERHISIRVPHKYHITPRSTKYLIGFTISAVSSAFMTARLITFGANTIQAYIGTFIVHVVEITAFVTNVSIFVYCKRNYKSTVAYMSLNGRYQIQETYNVARAMLPVYLFSFIFKIPILIFNWLFILDLVDYYLTDFVGMIFFAVSTASVSSVFLLRHNSLRHRTQLLFCRCIYEKHHTKSAEEAPTTHQLTSAHFEMLDSMWK